MNNQTKTQINALRVLILAVVTLSMMGCNQESQSSDEADHPAARPANSAAFLALARSVQEA